MTESERLAEQIIRAVWGAGNLTAAMAGHISQLLDAHATAAVAADHAARSQPLAPLSEAYLRELETQGWGRLTPTAEALELQLKTLLHAYRGLEGILGDLCEDLTGERLLHAVERRGWVRGMEEAANIAGIPPDWHVAKVLARICQEGGHLWKAIHGDIYCDRCQRCQAERSDVTGEVIP